jgi:methylmalonyl-CoA epimerase
MIKRLHHVGIAVNNLDESVALYERILGLRPVSTQDVPSQQVRTAFFEVGGESEIELFEPTAPDTGISRFLEKRGQGIHHICFEVDDVDEELKAMAEEGIELIDRQGRTELPGKPGFVHPKSTHGVLIELVQPGS